MSHGRCAELQRLAERAASEGQAQRELAEAAQRDFLNRLAAAQAATQTAAGDSAATAAGLREELRAREAELAVLRRREAEAAAQAAATGGAHALRLAALEEAHAARVASLEEAHAARAATLESGRRILLQGGDDRARLKEELLRLHQELYSTQARTAIPYAPRPLARARPVYRGKGLWPGGQPCGNLCPSRRAPRRAACGCAEPRGPRCYRRITTERSACAAGRQVREMALARQLESLQRQAAPARAPASRPEPAGAVARRARRRVLVVAGSRPDRAPQ